MKHLKKNRIWIQTKMLPKIFDSSTDKNRNFSYEFLRRIFLLQFKDKICLDFTALKPGVDQRSLWSVVYADIVWNAGDGHRVIKK